MKVVYIETSAVLTWLLGEPDHQRVVDCLNDSDMVVTSVLTRLEVERSLLRAERGGMMREAERQKVRGLFARVSSSWAFLALSEDVLKRASGAFPVEPVRSLDAIHLASALEFLGLYPALSVLSFDKRIYDNLDPLGLPSAL